ncbi:polysaccharide biosynthesis tyrosine autokinase [Luteibacter jiangsuensis]|uniref:Polysaccharide biosynthesis tyrosine autokinase n=1 Tax=Luteibacter jiangsuensis TaxID=637577 RepID=A0ABX0Q123_9GAMM|nr:polysaccharide biosynthesis tyrosine autokinase [Luteibacter jiangsuensis]NID03387.1 polysaccharide biosynthesis tyrosine autokinase [Luteibacter jiangsuensis]
MTTKIDPVHDEDTIDLNALFGTLLDHKWIIAAITGTFFVAGVLYTMLATPIYQATAVVQVEQKTPSLPGLSDLTQSLGTTASQATTEIALITSRLVVGTAVNDLRLDVQVQPRRLPLLGDYLSRGHKPGDLGRPRFGLSRFGWGGEVVDIFRLDLPDSLMGKKLELRAEDGGRYALYDDDGKRILSGAVGQLVRGGGATMQLKQLTANPGTRFDVLVQPTLTTISKLQGDIVALEQGNDSGIIGLSYNNADPDLARRVLAHITSAYVRQNVERNSAEAASQLQFVKDQLPKVRQELDRAQAAMNDFQTKAHSIDLSMQTKGLLDQIVAVENNIQQLHLQEADIDRRFTHDHPAYKALQQQMGQLQAQKDKMQKEVGDLPDTQQQLLKLNRDVQVSSNTYTSLLNQAQQLDIARAGTVGNVRIVDTSAVDKTQPVQPRKALVVVVATFLGGFLALAFVFLRQVLNRGIEDPAAIEDLGLPVYASVPLGTGPGIKAATRARQGKPSRGPLLAIASPNDLAVEAIRSLRTSLHFARLEAKNNVLMITGSSPFAGKTFVSANLAAVIAQAGQRVLLVDGDMRRGTLHQVLGIKPALGLSDLLVGGAELAEVIQPGPLPNVSFVARGRVPPNPSELLMHENFTRFIASVVPSYDLVVIDTPPILAVTDAAVIGHHAGTSLLVARFGLNKARELALAKQRFEQNGVELKGAIFNAVERRASGYSTYAYYKYKADPA